MRHGQQQAGTQAGNIVRLASRAEVAEIVANLVGNAERFTVSAQDLRHFLVLFRAGVNRAQAQRHFKRRRGLLTEDIENLQGGERRRLPRPAQFVSLPATKLPLSLGSHQKHPGFLLR